MNSFATSVCVCVSLFSVCVRLVMMSLMGFVIVWVRLAILCLADVWFALIFSLSSLQRMRDEGSCVWGMSTENILGGLIWFIPIHPLLLRQGVWLDEWVMFPLPACAIVRDIDFHSFFLSVQEFILPSQQNAKWFWKDTCSDLAGLIALHRLWLVKYWMGWPKRGQGMDEW